MRGESVTPMLKFSEHLPILYHVLDLVDTGVRFDSLVLHTWEREGYCAYEECLRETGSVFCPYHATLVQGNMISGFARVDGQAMQVSRTESVQTVQRVHAHLRG